MLFLAATAARLMDPYVPADNLVLAQDITISAEEDVGHVTYNSPYAHYQYEGELYGPNYPISDGGEAVGFFSPPHKTPTGKRLEYSTFRHPLATDHWDKAMMTARKEDLAKSYEEYLKRR
ncbi:MAG: minor capsid protein [Lachnospiraceae bacterium]